ncbi:MAG: glycosyltransferase family 2 protein [Bryobacteraceae bacterium]|nr:glycosyltransferase family 2 protein [Bryobacteraceae bacterium]
MKAAAVIVTYNSGAEIAACLEACRPHVSTVVVVDNASTDGSAEFATIRNAKNLGFAAAVNQGFQATSESVVLVLNPDCRIQGGLEAMTALFDDPKLGAAGGLLLTPGGQPQTGFTVRRFPTWANQAAEIAGLNRFWPANPLNRKYRALDLDLTHEQDVDQPAGAFLMIRRTAWEQLGGFDEAFFPVWFEDVDFCYRLRQNGWRIRYSPLARATHAGGHSVNKLSWRCKQMHWYASLLRYAEKHWGGRGKRRVALTLLLMSLPRGVYGSLLRFSPEPLVVYGKIAGQAWDVLRGRRLALHRDS